MQPLFIFFQNPVDFFIDISYNIFNKKETHIVKRTIRNHLTATSKQSGIQTFNISKRSN